MTNQERAAELINRADLEPADQYPLLQDIAAALAQREREIRHEYEWILKELVEWGMQTDHCDLDLTTAEFSEIRRGAQLLRAKAQEVQS